MLFFLFTSDGQAGAQPGEAMGAIAPPNYESSTYNFRVNQAFDV